MKKLAIVSSALFFVTLLTAKAQLFPKVDKPSSDDMSLIALEFGREDEGKIIMANNVAWSGWAPAVTGPDGKEIPFRNYDSGADITNIYYAENLPAGEYTLTGFYHVYTDFDKLDEHRSKTGEEELTRYAPYENLPYHVRQHFALPNPITIKLDPKAMASFGTFIVKYRHFEAFYGGTSNKRSSVVEEDFEYVTAKPHDDHILRYMKPWRTPAWKKWNVMNPAEPL
jgi:hypothetical protein